MAKKKYFSRFKIWLYKQQNGYISARGCHTK